MGNLFTAGLTPEQQLKESRAALRKSIRELERERNRLQAEERRLLVEIKQLAQQGRMKAATTVTKNLVRIRHNIDSMYDTKSKLDGLRMQIRQLNSVSTMENAMRQATIAMHRMNRRINTKQMSLIMREFEKQTSFLEMKQDMMDDVIDDAQASDEDEMIQGVLSEVLDEIGVQIGNDMQHAPTGSLKQEDAELSERIKNLKDRE